MTEEKKEHPKFASEVEEFFGRLPDKEPDSATLISVAVRAQPDIGRARMGKINAKKTISKDERDSVNQLNEALSDKIPKKTPRYQEIAEKLELKTDRVRYIIEGSR